MGWVCERRTQAIVPVRQFLAKVYIAIPNPGSAITEAVGHIVQKAFLDVIKQGYHWRIRLV